MKAPVPQQPSITNQFAKKKPITLASLGVSNQNLGGAKSVALGKSTTPASAPTPAPAPAPTSTPAPAAPAPAAQAAPSTSSLSTSPKTEKTASEDATSPETEYLDVDSPEVATETEPSTVSFFPSLHLLDDFVLARRAYCQGRSPREHQRRVHRPCRRWQVHHLRQHHVHNGHGGQAHHREIRARSEAAQPRELVPCVHHGHERRGARQGRFRECVERRESRSRWVAPTSRRSTSVSRCWTRLATRTTCRI